MATTFLVPIDYRPSKSFPSCVFYRCFLAFQLELIDRIMALNQQQMQTFEELTKLEQRISCKFLPESFNRDILNVDVALPLKEQQKKVQQMKRSMLDDLVKDLEIKLLDYLQQYERELSKLEQSCTCEQYVHGISLFDHINICMSHRIAQFKRELGSNMILFRKILHRRFRRCRSCMKIDTLSVWPQVVVDVPTIPLNAIEFSYISSAGWLPV
jgi:hypothetical protein